MTTVSNPCVFEDLSRLECFHGIGRGIVHSVVEALKRDHVALIRGVHVGAHDELMRQIADTFGLVEDLELQAGFAAYQGHRQNVGKYFMSVNSRKDYQFIPPHSEGTSFICMQLAAFYCYENSTDGGETVLLNVDDSSKEWDLLREHVKRGRTALQPLSSREIARARGLYQLNMPKDLLGDDDRVLQERSTDIPGFTVYDVLAKPRKCHSRMLQRDTYTLWDSISSIDGDSARQYANLLRHCGLLKEPPDAFDLARMDNTSVRHIWSSEADYSQIFKCKLTVKLTPGDFIVQNNLTWTHSASNWTPKSGVRNVAASFA